MRRKIPCLFLAVLLALGCISGAAAEEHSGEGRYLSDMDLKLRKSHKKDGENNPLFTQRFGADPGVMEYEGRIYVYLTNDVLERNADGEVTENTYSQIRYINCLSSADLVNWTDHGIIPVAGDAGIAKWAGNSWAPCAAHKTIDGKEKFFLYFCNGGNGIGVLAADSPTGPWRDETGKLLITRKTPTCANVVWLFDPAVMVDDDGTGYLAFGGGVPEGKVKNPGTARIVRLGDDMMSLDGDPVVIDAPYLFEDSGINKIGGRYIYSYCSNWQTEGNSLRITNGAIEYMTSDSPLGPYTYQGELFPNEGRFFGLYGNNHHSIACLNGEYYLFYHSRPVEKSMKISGNYRSPQVDRITLNEDGTFRSVVGTMKGVEQLKPLDPYQEVPGTTIANQAGLVVETDRATATAHVKAKDGGRWLKAAGVDFAEGAKSLTLRCASEEGCEIYVLTDSLEAPIAATVTVPAGTSEAAEFTVPFEAEGIHDLYIVFGGAGYLYSWQAGK